MEFWGKVISLFFITCLSIFLFHFLDAFKILRLFSSQKLLSGFISVNFLYEIHVCRLHTACMVEV